jgi:tetratricopeptide (TPR) repeat protein
MRLVIAILWMAILFHSSAALADKALAREHYKKGMAAFTLESYDLAIEEFRTGFQDEPDPVFLFNIAQAYRLSNRPREAITFYKKYLRLAPAAKNRAAVEVQLTRIAWRRDHQRKRAT